MDGYPLADAPSWLPDLIDRMPINLDMLNGSIKGNARKAFLFGVARECWQNGMALDHAEQRILTANTKCHPVFEGKELDFYMEIATRRRELVAVPCSTPLTALHPPLQRSARLISAVEESNRLHPTACTSFPVRQRSMFHQGSVVLLLMQPLAMARQSNTRRGWRLTGSTPSNCVCQFYRHTTLRSVKYPDILPSIEQKSQSVADGEFNDLLSPPLYSRLVVFDRTGSTPTVTHPELRKNLATTPASRKLSSIKSFT